MIGGNSPPSSSTNPRDNPIVSLMTAPEIFNNISVNSTPSTFFTESTSTTRSGRPAFAASGNGSIISDGSTPSPFQTTTQQQQQNYNSSSNTNMLNSNFGASSSLNFRNSAAAASDSSPKSSALVQQQNQQGVAGAGGSLSLAGFSYGSSSGLSLSLRNNNNNNIHQANASTTSSVGCATAHEVEILIAQHRASRLAAETLKAAAADGSTNVNTNNTNAEVSVENKQEKGEEEKEEPKSSQDDEKIGDDNNNKEQKKEQEQEEDKEEVEEEDPLALATTDNPFDPNFRLPKHETDRIAEVVHSIETQRHIKELQQREMDLMRLTGAEMLDMVEHDQDYTYKEFSKKEPESNSCSSSSPNLLQTVVENSSLLDRASKREVPELFRIVAKKPPPLRDIPGIRNYLITNDLPPDPELLQQQNQQYNNINNDEEENDDDNNDEDVEENDEEEQSASSTNGGDGKEKQKKNKKKKLVVQTDAVQPNLFDLDRHSRHRQIFSEAMKSYKNENNVEIRKQRQQETREHQLEQVSRESHPCVGTIKGGVNDTPDRKKHPSSFVLLNHPPKLMHNASNSNNNNNNNNSSPTSSMISSSSNIMTTSASSPSSYESSLLSPSMNEKQQQQQQEQKSDNNESSSTTKSSSEPQTLQKLLQEQSTLLGKAMKEDQTTYRPMLKRYIEHNEEVAARMWGDTPPSKKKKDK